MSNGKFNQTRSLRDGLNYFNFGKKIYDRMTLVFLSGTMHTDEGDEGINKDPAPVQPPLSPVSTQRQQVSVQLKTF